jgi:GH15 family glucan-1,4-alpha-glucosidase
MSEIDSYGYLADCLLTYLRYRGKWESSYWDMIARLANFTVRHWRSPGSSIWELLPERQFLASKIMSLVTLDRALAIAEQIGKADDSLAEWRKARSDIFAEIMSRGWSERLNSFRQHYDADTVDASSLLLPIMDVLPADHPRVTSTVERLVEHLDVNGLLHRFVDSEAAGERSGIAGDEEGAFLMCSFWLAQILAQRNEIDRAEAILRHTERVAGEPGLLAESADARNDTFLGNTPLLFSQVEYARAAMALDEALMRNGRKARPVRCRAERRRLKTSYAKPARKP